MSFLDARITQNLHLKIKIQTKRADGPVRRSKYEKSCAMSSLFCFLCQLKSITKPVHAYLPLDFSKLGEKRLVFFSVAWVLSISRLESFLGNPCLSICGPLKRTSLAADVFSVAWVLSIYQLSFFSLDFKVIMEYPISIHLCTYWKHGQGRWCLLCSTSTLNVKCLSIPGTLIFSQMSFKTGFSPIL